METAHDLDQAFVRRSPSRPLVSSCWALNREKAWFADPDRPARDNLGPHLIVVDGFYRPEQAAQIRGRALAMRYERYSPPEAGQVDDDGKAWPPGTWRSTAVVYFQGRPVRRPFLGERFNPPWLRDRLARVVGEAIDPETWDFLGDHWNGAFHLIEDDWLAGRGAVHHHYKDHDVFGRGWSGLVYLSPDPPPGTGTSIWRDKATGRCVAGHGAIFSADLDKFELALEVENRFNRLVLFRENVLHRADRGFGRGLDARLTQTLFFRSARASPSSGAPSDRTGP